MEWLKREINLIGEENIEKLKDSEVTIFGLGGVGSFTLETLVRTGIGRVNIVDYDTIDITNLNRQLYALRSTIGKKKVDVAYERCLDINPNIVINKFDIIIENKEQVERIIKNSDYVIDCIDTMKAKLDIIEVSKELNIPVISSMGTGNKLNPKDLRVEDVYKTRNCPISKIMRKGLREREIDSLKVICSYEENKKIDKTNKEIATISFVPSVAGILLSAECIRDILGLEV